MTTKKRGRGRPSLGAAARRNVITIKFSDDELARIQKRAEDEVLPVADFIRTAALEAAARPKE